MRPLSQLQVVLRLLWSIPLLILTWVEINLVELKRKMKKQKQFEKSSAVLGKPGKTSPPSKRSSPPQAQPGLSPFEVEAGRAGIPEEDLSLEKKGSSTGSLTSDVVAIDPKVAGSLLVLGFDVIHGFVPDFPPLDEKETDQMADPFAKFLVDQGWEDVAKSSVVFFIRLGSVLYKHGRIAVAARKVRAHEEKAKADPGDGKARPGQDDAGKTDNPRGG